jgi:RHS repeat-associated protein
LERNLGSSKLNLEFGYSANLNRVWKRVTEPGKPLSPETTIYVNDGMGNPVAIYRKETTPSGGFNYFLEDEFIVGQGRLGAIRRNVDVFTSVSLLSGSMLKERLMFELIDHLGSARAVVSGLKSVTGSAEVVSLQDHYPFGMEMPMRGFVGDAYRFGYERQEKMPELFMGCYTFEYREYDSRIGRFFHSDPLALNYAFYSPYQFSGNKVIIAPELEGLESASDQQVESGNPSPLPRTTTQENAIFIPNNASGTEFYADMDGLSRQIDWELGFVGVTSPEGKWEITSKLNTYMAMVENWKNPNHEGAISNLSIQDDEGNVIIVNFGFYLMGEDFVPENPEETVIVTTNYSASKGTSANTSHADDQSLSVTVSAGTGNEQGASASGKINDVGIGAESKQTLTTGLEATRIKGTTDASGQGSTADHRKDTEVQQPNTAMVGNAVFRVTYSFKKIYSNPDGGASLHEGHYFLHNVGSIKYFADRSASY